MEMEGTIKWRDYQLGFAEWSKTTCKENRIGLMKMLLSNLTVPGVKHVQDIAARVVKRRKFSIEPTKDALNDDEDGWWEEENFEKLVNWAGYTREYVLIGYIKLILPNYRQPEVQEIKSTWTARARTLILHPERFVSRLPSVPNQVGWWTVYQPEDIVAVDCENIANKIGIRSNGKPRCKQVAGIVSVVSYDEKILYKKTIYHEPSTVYLTPYAKKITGFNERSFLNGTQLSIVQEELKIIFQNKLLVFISAGNDFLALGMDKGEFDVFDLHEHYENDRGKIGLNALVMHFYGINIQQGIHDPDIDAKYTMKIFREQYIPDKLAHPEEANSRITSRKFNNIHQIKRD